MKFVYIIGALGDFLLTLRGNCHQFDTDAGVSKHVDKGIYAKKINLTLEEIADAGLGDSEHLGRISLLQTPGLDGFTKFDHQIRSNLKMLGFLRREAKIRENVSA